MAIKTGIPIPTLTPMMTLFETPRVSPLRASLPFPLLSAAVASGTNEVGLPEAAIILCALFPNATVEVTESNVVAGNVGSSPSGTSVTRVRTVSSVVVPCKEAGQLTRPDDLQV